MNSHSSKILNILEKTYEGRTTALMFNNPFQLLVATILSAQSTDKQVNKLTDKLFEEYPTPGEMAKLTEDELAIKIKGCGLYKNKAKNIKKTINILLDTYNGNVPKEREDLMKLPGVGRKTANVVLANAFNIPALAVDTHVFRVANRLGLAKGKTPDEIEKQLTALIPQQKWAEAHHWLIWHGREICKAKNPLCKSCLLLKYCSFHDKTVNDERIKEDE